MLLIRRFAISLAGSALGLLGAALLMGGLFVLDALHSSPGYFLSKPMWSMGFIGTLLYGAGPAVIGAVAYAVITARWRVGWPKVGVLGGVCGSLVTAFDAPLLPFGVAAGIVAGEIAHALVRHRLSPDNLSNPPPRRRAV